MSAPLTHWGVQQLWQSDDGTWHAQPHRIFDPPSGETEARTFAEVVCADDRWPAGGWRRRYVTLAVAHLWTGSDGRARDTLHWREETSWLQTPGDVPTRPLLTV